MPDEDDESVATFRYNDEHTKCTVGVGECEFPDVDVADGGSYFLHDDEAGKHYLFVVGDDDLEDDTVYELVELETVEAEEEEAAEGTAT